MKRERKEGIPIARNALSYSITMVTIQKGPSDEQIDNDVSILTDFASPPTA